MDTPLYEFLMLLAALVVTASLVMRVYSYVQCFGWRLWQEYAGYSGGGTLILVGIAVSTALQAIYYLLLLLNVEPLSSDIELARGVYRVIQFNLYSTLSIYFLNGRIARRIHDGWLWFQTCWRSLSPR